MKYLPLIFILILILTIVIIVVYWIRRIRTAIRRFSREVWGTDSITEGAAVMKEQYASTPKSVSGLTSLCLPRIVKDFPDFDYNEMKSRANNLLVSYLHTISSKELEELEDANQELENKISNYITMLDKKNVSEHFDKINLHRTEILEYRKSEGRCIVTFQTSIEYYHYLTDENDKVVEGDKDLKFQSKYDIDLIYVQDRDFIDTQSDQSLGVNCPNCGAPLKTVGSTNCSYCGTPIIALNIHAWTFSDVRES